LRSRLISGRPQEKGHALAITAVASPLETTMRYLVPATDVPKRLDELEVPGLSKTRPEVPKPKKVPCRARNANRCRSDSTDWTTGTRATRFAPRQVLSGVFCPRPSADLALPGIPEGLKVMSNRQIALVRIGAGTFANSRQGQSFSDFLQPSLST